MAASDWNHALSRSLQGWDFYCRISLGIIINAIHAEPEQTIKVITVTIQIRQRFHIFSCHLRPDFRDLALNVFLHL